MSFVYPGWGSSSLYNALYDAYYTYDILLVAATGNPNVSTSFIYPKAWPFVTGVGGVNSDGSNFGHDSYQEVSGLAGGITTTASCPYANQFCTPSFSYNSSIGGTSSATAIVAGIAGLVRAYNPTLTAPQVRQRLINTATGTHKKVDALAAVLNRVPLSASISGLSFVQTYTTETWYASVSGGTAPYSYRWYRNNSQVSAGSSYTGNTGGADFQLRLEVTDAAGTTKTASLYITVRQCSGSGPECPV